MATLKSALRKVYIISASAPSHHWFWFLYSSHLRGTVCLLCIQEEQEACKKTGRVINFSLIAELQFQKWDDLVKKIAEIEKGNMGNMTAMQGATIKSQMHSSLILTNISSVRE